MFERPIFPSLPLRLLLCALIDFSFFLLLPILGSNGFYFSTLSLGVSRLPIAFFISSWRSSCSGLKVVSEAMFLLVLCFFNRFCMDDLGIEKDGFYGIFGRESYYSSWASLGWIKDYLGFRYSSSAFIYLYNNKPCV